MLHDKVFEPDQNHRDKGLSREGNFERYVAADVRVVMALRKQGEWGSILNKPVLMYLQGWFTVIGVEQRFDFGWHIWIDLELIIVVWIVVCNTDSKYRHPLCRRI